MPVLRNKPKFQYCGLTIILANRSRFDRTMLLTAGAGHVVNQCLKPYFNSMHCDVREADDKSELLPGTKVIMLLGEYSYVSWMAPTGNVLNEIRGSVLSCRGVPTICSYYPQDCADFKAFERTLNPDSKEYSPDDSGRDDDDADGDEKRITHTKRSNYYFWLKSDFKKALTILKEGKVPFEKQPTYITYPGLYE